MSQGIDERQANEPKYRWMENGRIDSRCSRRTGHRPPSRLALARLGRSNKLSAKSANWAPLIHPLTTLQR